jgi:hypothetical protein
MLLLVLLLLLLLLLLLASMPALRGQRSAAPRSYTRTVPALQHSHHSQGPHAQQ